MNSTFTPFLLNLAVLFRNILITRQVALTGFPNTLLKISSAVSLSDAMFGVGDLAD
ncbi:hypothetical protein TcasGA2_TC032442 [Tribolium castaneum]|uniref:Uncharacterized protein n=1 Tax=Tribolium castaneum TaxID=7070 RepID=A0A139WLN9_TRICA|nr:hypothetical protein TcasGA2_TC032442 [Tribolium castaneum]